MKMEKIIDKNVSINQEIHLENKSNLENTFGCTAN